jgi:hypothetical protein
MANGSVYGPDDNKEDQGKKSKKPYTKPSFQFERVFETQALRCGKIGSHSTICKINPKVS